MVRRSPVQRLHGLHFRAVFEAHGQYVRAYGYTPAPSDPQMKKTAKTTEYVNFRTGPAQITAPRVSFPSAPPSP